ncbi:MAG: hypothetical protein FD149_1521 [Rhodospirillaceae bacterium]|nr:MAG: hypothetical protein FD149_1521 [Rhodospirillaceae bacterium]
MRSVSTFLRTCAVAAAVGSFVAIGGMAGALAEGAPQNPCAPKVANPCAPKAGNPCAPKKAGNPCAPTKAENPCAPKAGNPCAPKH